MKKDIIKLVSLFINLCFIIYNVNSIAQTTQKEISRIEWKSGSRLNWEDFKGIPDYSDKRIAAITSSVIQYKYYCENDTIHFSSKAIFICNESWVKPENKNQKTLNHEQLHFDITEFFNRMLVSKVSKTHWGCNQVEELELLVTNVLKEWREAQIRYDRDTWYSLNSYMQNEWDKLVEEKLSNGY